MGWLLGENAAIFSRPAQIILQLLGAVAPPLILIAVVHVSINSDIPRSAILKLASLLLLNTVIAITIGLTVANILRPGTWSESTVLPAEGSEIAKESRVDPLTQLLGSVPRSFIGPLGDTPNVIGVIIIAIAVGVALRRVADSPITTAREAVDIAYRTLLVILHWIIELVPLGVLCVVANTVGREGFQAFVKLGAFVVAVLLALILQTCWYLLRVKYFSWVRPLDLLRGMRDALVMAFSTDSSTATMPVTYACLREKVGVRERSASLGALVGANFNNDGTALYEAMAALFVAQISGVELDLMSQLTVVFTSILASVGAAGIPEAGIVTMTLVFTAVGLDVHYIPLLLTVDWFLDRCRTVINVLGDVNVSCILDGRTRGDGLLQTEKILNAEG